jgi:CO/xanthine dehydrogenase FAD-binding subunit
LESPEIARALPVMQTIAGHIGLWAIRTQGSMGGSLCHADPAAEWPAFTLAAGAGLLLRSVEGVRTVPAQSFFTGYMETALKTGEVLEQIEIPLTDSAWGFCEITRRPGDFASAGSIFQWQGDSGRAAVFVGSLAHAALLLWTREDLDHQRARRFRTALQEVLEDSDAYTLDIFTEAMLRSCSQALGGKGENNGR